MIRRFFRHAVTMVATFATLLAGVPLTAADQTPVEINAVLATTGPAALLGTREAEALGVLAAMVNKQGGIKGRPLKFTIVDDGSDPRNTVQLVNQLIARKVNAIVGPNVTATCQAVLPLVATSGPFTYCLSPLVHPAPGVHVLGERWDQGLPARDVAVLQEPRLDAHRDADGYRCQRQGL